MIEKLLKKLPGIFKLYDYQQQFEKVFKSIGIDNLSLEMIQTVVKTRKYTKYGEIYSNRKLTDSDILPYLFKYYVNKPLRIDNDGVSQLQALARRHLNYDLGNDIQSIVTRLRNSKNLLLVDRLTFKNFDSSTFNTTLIWEIDFYLNYKFIKSKIINVKDIFNIFEDRLKKIEVYNKIHIHSLIKYYLENKYIVGQGNTLNIYKKQNKVLELKNSAFFHEGERGHYSREQ